MFHDDQYDDSWRMFRIMSDFSNSEILNSIKPAVSIFGSSRLIKGSIYYNLSEGIAKELAKKGFNIITGGGPGAMEAANKGAQSSKVKSCGLCIDIEQEKIHNDFIDEDLLVRFKYFFMRKVMFMKNSEAFVIMPGGLGTFDELFELLTLIQTKKMPQKNLYLMGREFWKDLLSWIKTTVLREGMINESDLSLIKIEDDPKIVANEIYNNYIENTNK